MLLPIQTWRVIKHDISTFLRSFSSMKIMKETNNIHIVKVLKLVIYLHIIQYRNLVKCVMFVSKIYVSKTFLNLRMTEERTKCNFFNRKISLRNLSTSKLLIVWLHDTRLTWWYLSVGLYEVSLLLNGVPNSVFQPDRAVVKWMSKVITWLRLQCLVICLKV